MSNIQQITVPTYLQCVQFAVNTLETNYTHYQKRGQFNVSKMLNDITQGKLAEVAVYYWLQSRGNKPQEPDFTRLHANQKSYDADIFCNGKKLHVKSMSKYRANKYGCSFLFQKNDPLVINPSPTDYIIFCTIDDLTVQILTFKQASEVEFKEPVKEELKANKMCVYL